ncbi:MAG: WG repeat-containing protein [Clostridiales bacterium]|nr:WG repeat-containing protein [Clostridiales bacterium]
MKIKKPIVALLCATLAITACGALVACGNDQYGLGTTTINLADYVDDTPTEIGYATKTALERINPNNTAAIGSYYSSYYRIFKTFSSPATYSVYFVETGERMTDLTEQPTVVSGTITTLRLSRTNSSTGMVEYAYCAPDGTMIFDYNRYVNSYYDNPVTFTSVSMYEGDNKTATRMIKATAIVKAGETNETITKYFKIDTKSHSYTSYTEVSESNLKEVPSYAETDYTVGGNPDLQYVTYTGSDLEVNGGILDYRYKDFGDTRYFYKNGDKTGSVDMKDGEELGFVGNNFYYYTITTAAPESSSYNLAVQVDGTLVKGNYKLFRYDVVKNSTKELDTDLMILRVDPMYNYSAKAYDAARVYAVEKTDGVFYYADIDVDVPVGESDSSVYIADSSLRIACQVPDEVRNYTSLYKLTDDRFALLGYNSYNSGYVFDGGYNYVCDISGSLYVNEQLISFTHGGKVGLKDYNGKIVIEPKYKSIGTFYGGIAIATKENDDGETISVLLNKNGSETALPQNDAEEGVYVETYSNGIYVVSTRTDSKYTVTVYNYEQKAIKTFENVNTIGNVYVNGSFVSYSDGEYDEVYKIK